MGQSREAVSKGVRSELYAKSWYVKAGYTVLTPETHEKPYDFVVEKDGRYNRVQVKTAVRVGDLYRFRNKHGSSNKPYSVDDYDILCGVWEGANRIFFFYSQDVNYEGSGEAITVGTASGRKMKNFKRPEPFFTDVIV